MRNFWYIVGQVVAYIVVILAGVAALIALGYLFGAITSVHDEQSPSTSGVCTSTLCQ